MKRIAYLILTAAISAGLSSCSGAIDSSSEDTSSQYITTKEITAAVTSAETTETTVAETVQSDSTVSSQLDSSFDSSFTETTTAAEDPLHPKPVIDEAAVSSAKAQLADNDIIVRKDTVRNYSPFSTKKCVLYVTSCGDYYAAYYERENENDDRFWINDIADTPQTIDEIDGTEYLGKLTDEEISELINFSLSVDPEAACYEHLRGEDESAPAEYHPSYNIYTFMIWSEDHNRTIYTAFVWDSHDYFLNSSDEYAYAAAMILNHGDIFNTYYRYCNGYLDLY